jgi:MoxR-like ATPase
VIITSNVERQLPAPFLRRCIFHHIELTDKLVRDAVEARVNNGAFPKLSTEVRQAAISRFWELRDDVHRLQKPPATGELLVWLAILNAQGIEAKALDVPLHELPCVGALVKDHEDFVRLKT